MMQGPTVRLERLCRASLESLELELSGIRVLTEAATGAYAATAVLAALSGAEVIAVCRDSRWGSADTAVGSVRALARTLGVDDRITYHIGEARDCAADCELVTNLGFVRPIDAGVVERLGPHAVVALMWEPWEYRSADIDLESLRAAGVPIIGTNERHPLASTFSYLGPTVGRLLLNSGIEIVNSNLVVVGADPFGSHIEQWLSKAGADVTRAALDDWRTPANAAKTDAVVIAEHRSHAPVVHGEDLDLLQGLADRGAPLIHLCGAIDYEVIIESGVELVPDSRVPAGVMSVTTAHAGPRPVVDLHAVGLKAGSIVVQGRRNGLGNEEATNLAVEAGFGLPFVL